MAKLTDLIADQNRTWARMQEIRAAVENGEWTAEQRSNWDAAETHLSELEGDITRMNNFARREAADTDADETRQGPQGDDEKRYADAFANYMKRGMGRVTDEERELLESHVSELRAQAVGSDPAGGYLVPEGWRNELIETLKAYGGIQNLAQPITTDSGQDLPWASIDDTGNMGEILGENTTVGSQDFAFGGRKLKAHIFTSKMIKIPVTLAQDSGFDLDTFVPRKCGERIGRRGADAWINGTGIDQPEGIILNARAGKTGASGQTTTLIYTDLIDLEHSVDVAYRNERAGFVWHDLTLAAIRKMEDDQHRPLWVPAPAAGFPATVNGKPYTVDNSMPQMAAGVKSILFGDIFAAYVVRMVQGITAVRLAERYADSLQVGYFSWVRMDGMVQDPAAYASYVNAAS